MKWCAVLLCLCFAAAAHGSGNSLKDPYICGPPSCTPSNKFKYSSEIIYHYEYKVKVETYFAGSSNNRSTLDVRAEVLIEFIAPCEGLLRLTDVTLIDQDENYPVERAEKFIHAVSLNDLRFAFHDGLIAEVCPEPHEQDWVLNFKRAILALYQNTMKRFDVDFDGVEQDIHGTCDVQYSVRGQQDTSLLLVKKRDLSQCRDRYKYMSILQTVRYDFQSKYQTWPVLKSESKCLITVDHNIYKGVNCRERHHFEPFSGRNSGAVTTVVQDLELMREVSKTDAEVVDSQPRVWSAIHRRANVLHHHLPYYSFAESGELKPAWEVLKLLCLAQPGLLPPPAELQLDSGSVVGLWARLVRASRPLHHPALASLLARSAGMCPQAAKYLLDALPYIASPGSVELIKEKIMKGEADPDIRHEWLMSMTMIPRPKLPMLQSMLSLAQSQRRDPAVAFAASSMVHSYCRNQGRPLRECCSEETPKLILHEFQEVVNAAVSAGLANATRDVRNDLVIALKAVGNIGGFQPEFTDVLLNIISDELVPVPIRLTAIDAFRRTPCLETREYFLATFREDFLNVEIRLASYQQVMRCPDLSTVRKIFHALKHESVNQVVTFVWSHLNNLGQSSLPSRVEIQGLISGNKMPQLEDSPDFRIFSRNYEQSVFFDQYNAGGNYEANVIFSPDSYIPRSVSLNLTVDMFGESINVFELKARGEGFETYFESIFGNNGPLSKGKINEQMQKLRVFRSADDADAMKQKIDDLGYKNEALLHRSPLAELGFKVFGNDISFWSAEGQDEIAAGMQKLDFQRRILEILSGKEISYDKASLFLDTTFSVPTGCGLPLSMNLMGTSYVRAKMAGTVVNKYREAGNLDFEGKLNPSVALNIAATMGVVAGGVASSGVRLATRLYTATGLGATLSVRAGRRARLDLSLPSGKQEIFAAKSELIILHGEQEMQQQGLNKRRIEQNTCSWSTFDKAIGIKVCAAYQFPNMENLVNAPYFLLSGPAKYVVSLEKADPSAITYSFEGKWDKNETSNVVQFSYDTPNSKEKRMFNALLSFSNTSSSASLAFQSAESTVKAKALYRNLPTDKTIEASLDVNGRKQFDTVMAVTMRDKKYGYVWYPRAYWIVNDERVAQLSGTLEVKTKSEVTQWDVDVDFETKQFRSRLAGDYRINGATHSPKLALNYQFVNGTGQVITLEGLFGERALGFRHDMYGDLAMVFSAYPFLNFYAVGKKVQTVSHFDFGFNVSSSRDQANDPSLAITFERVDRLNGLKLDVGFALVRPKPVKMVVQFEATGPKYTAYALLNFNPKARAIEVSGALLSLPGAQLFARGELNVTLPTLYPCVLKGKIHEKKTNEFQVNLAGVWFTGVDFNIDALYQDQSRTNKASHHLKLSAISSAFKDVTVDARFSQDNQHLTFIGEGQYDKDIYKTLMRYTLLSEQNFTTYIEVDVGPKIYSVNLNADLNNSTKLDMDVHVDQHRDLHLSYQRSSTPHQKRFSTSFAWDANRNHSQRVSLDFLLDRRADWHRAGQLALYYPGRQVNGDFEFLLKDWFCQWHVRTSWSNEAAILWRVKMYSEVQDETVYALLSNMDTPFQGWKDTSFNLMWRYHDNLQALNGSMHWQQNHLAFNLLADYLFKANEFYGEINAAINSTIPTLPRAAAVARHRGVWKKSADTLLSFQYNEDGLLMINSSWNLDRGAKENNITGRVSLITPFQGYTRGFLKTEFVFGHKRDIKGVTFLDLEHKVLKIYVNGHLRRITNCMVVVNVTSPSSARPRATARLGFVERDRHLVAMLVTPNTTTGIEVLLQLTSLQDFHVFGHVALPVQYLARATLTAKRAKEEVDFRVGWGEMDFGITGIWHWRSIVNFQYTYKLYTPIENFEENGLVLKNVYGPGLDTELSMQLSKHKFGIAILLIDNGKGLLDVLSRRFRHLEDIGDVFLEDFDTTASVVLNTLYYPTVTFHAHLMKFVGIDEEDIMEANATLHLPNLPPIVLTDVFILESYTCMRNQLHLATPFPMVQELKSEYTIDVAMGMSFNVTSVTRLFNGSHWHEISTRIYYEFDEGEDDTYQSYVTSLAIATPLKVLPSLTAAVTARLEDALWKMAADIEMPAFTVAARGRLELDKKFVETSGSLNLTSAYLDDYFIKMEFRKDTESDEKSVGGGIQVLQGEYDNYLFTDVIWRVDQPALRFKARGALVPVLTPSELAVQYNQDDDQKTLDCEFKNEGNYYQLKADQRPASVNVALTTPHENFRTMKIIGQFEGDDIRGSFSTDSAEYDVSGKVLNRTPLDISLILVPKAQGQKVYIRLKSESANGTLTASAHVTGPTTYTLHAKADRQEDYTDISIKVEAPPLSNNSMYWKSRVESREGLRRVVSVQAATPLKRLSYVKGDADFEFGPSTGYLQCRYELPSMRGDGDLKWSFLLGDLFIKALGHQDVLQKQRSVDLDIYFGNSTRAQGLQATDAGFRMDLDAVWQIGANASFGYIPNQRVNLVINAILPKPNVDVHTLYIDTDMGGKEHPVKTLKAEYKTDVTNILNALKGEVLLLEEFFNANATVTWTSDSQHRDIDNLILYKWDVNGSHFIDYALITPLYDDDETFKVKGSYQKDMVHGYKVIRGVMHRPGRRTVGEVDARYGGLKHTSGHFNTSTPFASLPWLKAIFDINNSEESSNNKVDLFWDNQYASLNNTHRFTKQDGGFEQAGLVSISIPLSTQHSVQTEYYYVEGGNKSTGNATLQLDGTRSVETRFVRTVAKSPRGLPLAVTDVEVENAHTPVAVHYEHEYDGLGQTDVKQATVYHLHNATKFNVTGKLDVFTYAEGKDLKFTAIQGNRTWTFDNKYAAVDNELKQGSKVTWAEDVWLGYDIRVTNLTANETESQKLVMNVDYPRRTFNLVALYNLQDTLLDGKAQLNWNVRDDNKTAELRGRWESPPNAEGSLHNVDLALSHPSFVKDVTLKGLYISTPSVMSNLSVDLQYSDYENEYLQLKSILMDNSNGPIRDYKFELKCTHPSTSLDLDMKTDININSKFYYFNNYYKFQKGLFHEEMRHNKWLIDLNASTVHYERSNKTYWYKANGTWELSYPRYRVLGRVARPTGNDTTDAVLDMTKRALVAHYNSTDDISYHVIGRIADTRSATFDAWRDYDDVTTVDIASYIRLNHSRLLTSSVVWRPEIFSQVKSQAVYSLKLLYSQINETLLLVKEAPMEAHVALKNIWTDAKPRVRDFLDDLNDLHVIKDDLDEFERFLNESYDNNDFYVKDVVEFTYYVLDEMALRNHLESLPGIVNDMWGMMGNTSQSIKQSLTYVIDTIKSAYSKFLESVNDVLEADLMELASKKLEEMILEYDNYVRDLHMKLLEYWEDIWVKTVASLTEYWKELLRSLEPVFFKVLHYTESFVVAVWRGLMDFFYDRTLELTDSPYFNYVSTFGHEMDKIYKDLIKNDLITNIKKYTQKLWANIWGKIERYIPYKDEFTQLYAEFRNAWNNFLKTPQVVYVREKCLEAYTRLRWWYDYFHVGEAASRVGQVLFDKLTDSARTALQYDDEHRTPKTNFIFDPHKGVIRLEQKLPMSWHAFNRTPDFAEIAEYKAVRDFLDDWVTNNKSLWTYYYEIRPYLDIDNVLPPFAGMAIMTGQGTLVTFDKRVFTISERGTFLLSKDYGQDNFTVLMESNAQDRYNLVVISDGKLVHVDLYNERVTVDGKPLTLPAGDTAWRRAEALTLQPAAGLTVQCNFLFRTCTLQAAGWYYASLGGLLGTYNNEQYDDLQLPNNTYTESIEELGHGWNLMPSNSPPMDNLELKNDTQCAKFFKNKVSPLHPCFSVIDAEPFHRECVRGAAGCALSSAYLELCAAQSAPAHIPEHCVRCTTPTGQTVEEGSSVTLDSAPAVADIVLVVEAARCNRNLRAKKNIDLLIEAFDSKLQDAGLSDNRYAIVGYGGRSSYRSPRALYVNHRAFATASVIGQHLDNFVIDNSEIARGNRSSRADVFAALAFAARLPLRPAAPRLLLLFPCSRCRQEHMRLGLSTVQHALLENSVTLHIVMDGEFTLAKKRAAKTLFGIDGTLAYTNKDYERLSGDAALRRQVRLPKDALGVCTSLAIETNGTIFAGARLSDSRAVARRVSSVLGARAAAVPCRAKPLCECRDARLHCLPCQDTQRMLEMSFWNAKDYDGLFDLALEPGAPYR